MNEIEYAFGTGDGTVDVWSTQANLELAGSPDAVRLDFDGDGLIDDAMWDTQGDGVADVAALDLNDDGVLDAFFTDPSGHGVWDHQITGTTADAASEPLDWIVRGEDPPAPGGPHSPAGYATPPHVAAPAADSFGAPQVPLLAGHPVPQPPMPLVDPVAGHSDPATDPVDGHAARPPAHQPGGVLTPPQLVPPVDPFARPDLQPGNSTGLTVQFNLEMQVNASPGGSQPSADQAAAGFAADGQH
ncbi:hypothetical protein IU438_00290 [Nocardia cyriacigeorgica]|uniref:hypothetical protein n=1 Tax=Nocardia cyriacigeorgica TaxID=135487 RepID=UPI00189559F6|nr:hypothetical protein [Nocardia cyriacigeorgica]MBF6092129.1 hypothetical protein [Nocardia cyriacigeorgica]MBF6315575.1 hypothetical protein [Nocardia cyriacigeorgica]MBF6394224.1 hypothetical protein [Nocardia cyriacigeorgica]MBF6399859.1 hypothetical protein [Nocardia cyriacigeorgica]MBF6495346.1 hypothetical protein [Nocardia cyriacigeorgica]